MKKIWVFLFFFLIVLSNASAQFSQSIRIKSGEDIYEKLAREIYLYPSFIKGTVFFKSEKANHASLNYNLLHGKMLFIHPMGDTLSIADEDSIKFIQILQDTFFFNKDYLQLIKGNNIVKLALKQVITVVDQEKIGGYGQPVPGGAVSSLDVLSTESQTFRLDIRRDLILDKRVTFYLGDSQNRFLPANKKNLLGIFPDRRKELINYLDKMDTNFNNVQDLIRLLNFMKMLK